MHLFGPQAYYAHPAYSPDQNPLAAPTVVVERGRWRRAYQGLADLRYPDPCPLDAPTAGGGTRAMEESLAQGLLKSREA